MNAEQRRKEIQDTLLRADKPVSATTLAQQFGVSRQIIVGDIALLRAGGTDICATPRGYVMLQANSGLVRQIACRHDSAGMAEELHTIVECDCTVLDVIVDHPIYGQITGPLQLSSHQDVDQFLARCAQHSAQPLSLLTEGIHLHTLACPSDEALCQVLHALSELQILLEE